MSLPAFTFTSLENDALVGLAVLENLVALNVLQQISVEMLPNIF